MEKIVVGVDGSEHSAVALRWAAREAELHGAELVAVLVWDLFNQSNGAQIDVPVSDTLASNNGAPVGNHAQAQAQAQGNSSQGSGGGSSSQGSSGGGPPNAKGPAASWRCDFEISNLSLKIVTHC